MIRPAEPEIPPGELLYRSISPADATDGLRVLPSAVDLPATSCNRSAYAAPESVFVDKRPEDTGIASIAAGNLPEPMAAPGGVTWEFLATDDPHEDNGAHAEIRIRPVGGTYSKDKKPSSKPFKVMLREALAGKMSVFRVPQLRTVGASET